jgi:hypothetical protein
LKHREKGKKKRTKMGKEGLSKEILQIQEKRKGELYKRRQNNMRIRKMYECSER